MCYNSTHTRCPPWNYWRHPDLLQLLDLFLHLDQLPILKKKRTLDVHIYSAPKSNCSLMRSEDSTFFSDSSESLAIFSERLASDCSKEEVMRFCEGRKTTINSCLYRSYMSAPKTNFFLLILELPLQSGHFGPKVGVGVVPGPRDGSFKKE